MCVRTWGVPCAASLNAWRRDAAAWRCTSGLDAADGPDAAGEGEIDAVAEGWAPLLAKTRSGLLVVPERPCSAACACSASLRDSGRLSRELSAVEPCWLPCRCADVRQCVLLPRHCLRHL